MEIIQVEAHKEKRIMKKKEVDEDQMMKFDIQKATIGNKK